MSERASAGGGCAPNGVMWPSVQQHLDELFATGVVTREDLGSRRMDLKEGGGWALAVALRLCTALTSLDLGDNGLGEGGGQALAAALRLNTTVKSLNLSQLKVSWNRLGEGGERGLAVALRLNTTVTLLNLIANETLRFNTALASLCLGDNDLGEGGAGNGSVPQHHPYGALPWLPWPGRGRRAAVRALHHPHGALH